MIQMLPDRALVHGTILDVEEIGHGWLFRPGPAMHLQVVNDMVTSLEKGNARNVERMIRDGFRIEAAQALMVYLNKRSDPLIPEYIQAIALDAPSNISPEVIATDILGLLKQDLPNKRIEILILLLGLLDTVIKYSPADELRGNTLPVSMLPLFFNITNRHTGDWRRIITIFVELIRLGASDEDIISIQTLDSNYSNIRVPEVKQMERYYSISKILRMLIKNASSMASIILSTFYTVRMFCALLYLFITVIFK